MSDLEGGIKIPTGEEVYNAIMGEIELDLLTSHIPNLDKKYAEETETEEKARLERYRRAYVKYDEVYRAWIIELKRQVGAALQDARGKTEAESKEGDEQELDEIESQFS